MVFVRAMVLLLLCCSVVQSAEWPQWLGPERDGSTSEVVKPWKGKLNVLWRKPVGEGHSSPVVAGGAVYLHTRVKDTMKERVSAYSAKSGELLWKTDYKRAPFKSLFGNGPRATPTVVGGRVYTFGITGVLSCFDAKKGKTIWQVPTLKKFDAKNLFFGMSCSPLIEGKRIFVNVGGKNASIVAFNKKNGKTLWRALNGGASYSSPIAIGKGKQIVFLTKAGLVSVAPEDGDVYWKFALRDLLSESSTTPVKVGDVLVGSSITYGSVGLRLSDKKKPSVKKLWKNPQLTCYFSTPVPVGKKHLYIVTGTKPPAVVIKATLRCIEVDTGKERWNRPNVGKYHAALVRTGNDKLLMLEGNGNLVMFDPSPKGYRELSRSKICGQTWAHPAVADGRLYVRDGEELICVELPK